MRTSTLVSAALCTSLVGTGCATKKYVQRTVAPVDTRVSATETKNAEQDKQIDAQAQQISELERGLSNTKEKLADTDLKATASENAAKSADRAAKVADQKADNAQQAADNASQTAAGARTYAQNLGHSVEGMNRFKLATFCQANTGVDRYIIEVQGFTDKTGPPIANELLSERRAQEVARHSVNDCKVPLRNLTMLGSGYAQPIADDSTRDGRKQNRRVEIRLFVPEVTAVPNVSQ